MPTPARSDGERAIPGGSGGRERWRPGILGAVGACPPIADDRRPSRRLLKRIFRRCETRLAGLPDPCDVTNLLRFLDEQRGRPIFLVPIAGEPSLPSGFWLASQAADFIGYEANTSRRHQEHIIAHELAHILCGHRVSEALNDHSARSLFPDLDPDLVRDMLQRNHYWDTDELEAEIMASMISERQHRRPLEVSWVTPAEALDVVTRIERSFSSPHRAST